MTGDQVALHEEEADGAWLAEESPARSVSPALLVRQILAGSNEAWLALHDRYVRLLWFVARSFDLATEDAHDVVQTTWLRLLEAIENLRNPGSVGSWLATTARRESQRLARQRTQQSPLDFRETHVTGPHHIVFRRERARVINEALESVPPRCRGLLTLLFVCPELSYAEIAATLDMPVGSIGPSRGRCLKHLRRRLEGEVL